jgi:hypothetical protein
MTQHMAKGVRAIQQIEYIDRIEFETLVRLALKHRELGYIKFVQTSHDHIKKNSCKIFDGITLYDAIFPSNSPHILTKDEGIKRAKDIKLRPGSSGIEYSLYKKGYVNNFRAESFVRHLDGKKTKLE